MLWALTLIIGPAAAWDELEGVRFYYGDLHAHTGASGDAGSLDLGHCEVDCGAVSELRETAQSNGLDFVAVSDHTNGPNAADPRAFREVQAQLEALHEPAAGFITIPSAEIWFELSDGSPLGHRNLLVFGDTVDELRVRDAQPNGDATVAVEDCARIWDWLGGVRERLGPAILVPHHPALSLPMPVDWGCHDAELEPVVEVYSAHGSSMGDNTGFDPPWSGSVLGGTVHFALDIAAHRLGFVAGTDSHDTRPGGTCELDPEFPEHPYGGGLTVVPLFADVPFDRESVGEAVQARHTYATSGPQLPVLVEFSSAGAWLGTGGDALELPEGQPLDVLVRLPPDASGAVLDVELVSVGVTEALEELGAGEWKARFDYDELPEWAYVRIRLDGDSLYGEGACGDGGGSDEYIWMSPVWFDPGSPDKDGDGVSWADGDCNDGDDQVSPDHQEICVGGLDEDCDGYADGHDPDCSELDSGSVDDLDTGSPGASIGTTPKRLPLEDPRVSPLTRSSAGCWSGRVAGSGWALVALGLLLRRRQM